MTLSERRYYRIAVLLSIIFHGALFLIHFTLPRGLGGQSTGLETMAPSMLDLGPGSPNTDPTRSETGEYGAAKPAPVQEVVTVDPEPKPQVKPEKVEPKAAKPVQEEVKIDKPKEVAKKEKPQTDPVPEHTTVNPVKEKPANPGKVAVTNNNESGSNGEGSKATGVQGGKGDKVPPAAKNFGSGDLMIASGMDTLINYPKNALNEGKEGDVTIRAFVDANGNIEKVDLVTQSGDPRLDNAAKNHIGGRLKFKAVKERYFVDFLVRFQVDAEVPLVKCLRSESRL